MNIDKIEFEPKTSYKSYILLSILIGLFLLVGIQQSDGLSQQEMGIVIFIMLILLMFIIVIPFVILTNVKSIILKKDKWKVKYLLFKKGIKFDNKEVDKVEIMCNINAKYISSYSQITIHLKEKDKLKITSLEINDYEKLENLIEKQFKFKIVKSDFWKGKIK